MKPVAATEHDIDVLARTLWAEARGEGMEGMIAAGWSVRNRVALQTWYGKTIAAVCQKPWQYSCWNKTDPNYTYCTGTAQIPPREFAKAIEAAKSVIVGTEDPTDGATHYYSTSMKTPPKWAAFGEKTVQVGRHIFFTNVK